MKFLLAAGLAEGGEERHGGCSEGALFNRGATEHAPAGTQAPHATRLILDGKATRLQRPQQAEAGGPGAARRIGKRRPLHAGTSRLLLAHAPEAVQTQVLAQRLPRFTPATRTDSAWIAADLQRIRARGYLLTTDEVVAGAATVAAPVRDASGQVVAALSISAPTMRMRPPRPRALLPLVLDTAAKLSRALGATVSDPVIKLPEPAKKGLGQAASQGREAATPALAAPGPHSIFR